MQLECQQFLKRHPNLKVVEADDTAKSAEVIKKGNMRGHAAICSQYAAELYGMKV